MKKSLRTYFLIVVLLMMSNVVSSQEYHSFIRDGAFWKGYHNPPVSSTYCYSNLLYPDGLMKYVIQGDTTVNNIHYFKLYRSVVGNTQTIPCTYSESLNYRGAIRDDSLNKKIYFLPPGQSIDTLLFNTNLTIGDTIKNWYNLSQFNITYVVQNIDSVYIMNQYRRYFSLLSQNSLFCLMVNLYEGIGTDCFFINDEPQNPQGFFCVGYESIDSTSLIGWEQEQCIGINVNSNEYYDNYLNSIEIFPNPAEESITIFQNTETNLPLHFSIFDIVGRVVKPDEIILNKETKVDLVGIHAGLYFIYLKHKDCTVIAKPLIIK